MFEDIHTTAPRRYGFLNLFQQLVFLRVVKKFNEIRREKKVSRIKTKTNIKIHTTIIFKYDDRGLLLSSNRLKK